MKYAELKNGNGSTQAESGTANDKISTPDRERKGSKRAQELHELSLKRAGNPEIASYKPNAGFLSAGTKRANDRYHS